VQKQKDGAHAKSTCYERVGDCSRVLAHRRPGRADSQLQVAPGALFFLKIREAAAVVGAIINRERLPWCSATTLQSTDTSHQPAAYNFSSSRTASPSTEAQRLWRVAAVPLRRGSPLLLRSSSSASSSTAAQLLVPCRHLLFTMVLIRSLVTYAAQTLFAETSV
jgi:hypothetical protein